MGTRVPLAARDLIGRWRDDGSPPQPGIEWPRPAWISAFPEHGVAFKARPDLLDRASTRGACMDAAADAQGATRAFVAVMAWGHGKVGYGRWRTRRILTETPDASARLCDVAKTLSADGALAAYRRLANAADCRIVGLGPAFGTKYLYFTQPPPQGPRALIVDALVTEWLDRETDLGFAAGAFSVPTYGRYLEMMHDWAASLGCEPDELESCMFRAIATERGSQWGGAAINTPGAGSGTRRRRNRAAAIKPPGRLTPEGMKGGSRVQGPFRTVSMPGSCAPPSMDVWSHIATFSPTIPVTSGFTCMRSRTMNTPTAVPRSPRSLCASTADVLDRAFRRRGPDRIPAPWRVGR